MYKGSVGIGYDDGGYDALVFKDTPEADYRIYIYPFMLIKGTGLFSLGFWKDCNWRVMLF